MIVLSGSDRCILTGVIPAATQRPKRLTRGVNLGLDFRYGSGEELIFGFTQPATSATYPVVIGTIAPVSVPFPGQEIDQLAMTDKAG